MNGATPPEPLPVGDLARERKRLARDRAARRRFADHLAPGPPVDGDAPELRVKAAGGISTLADAELFVSLGADRLGSSRIVRLVREEEKEDSKC